MPRRTFGTWLHQLADRWHTSTLDRRGPEGRIRGHSALTLLDKLAEYGQPVIEGALQCGFD
jgi:hypothetical protein